MLSPTIRRGRAAMRILVAAQTLLIVVSVVAVAPAAAADPSPVPSAVPSPTVGASAPPPSAQPSPAPSSAPESSVPPQGPTVEPNPSVKHPSSPRTRTSQVSPLAASISALQFDGTNDYVTFGAAPSLGLSTFTLEAWVKRTGNGATTTTSAAGGGGLFNLVPILTKGRGEGDGTNVDMNYVLGIEFRLKQVGRRFRRSSCRERG